MTKKNQSSYAQSGVDYGSLDPVKVLAQQAAAGTAGNLKSFGAHELPASRGESAYVWEEPEAYRSFVVEGLGTKNLVADAMRPITGKTYYAAMAKDTVAMIVNDLIVVGALPQVVNAYFATGNPEWMRDLERATDLVNGWADACQEIGATWGGGETPGLKGVIEPNAIDLGGAAVGIISPKSRLVLGDKLTAGDAIILVESSGIHANGISLVRGLADKNPGLYETELSNGRSFGEAILTPTHLYVSLVRDLMEAEIDIHYMVNVTGHGWRKLMRATKDNLSYTIDKIPETQPEFDLIQKLSGMSTQDMYGTFNMGAGFAIYVPADAAQKVVDIAKEHNLEATIAGHVEQGPKQVVIKPKNITFSADTLEVRS